jgi:ABC-type molybdenum transport system ATPase subunit/photorepair protein PhrA
MEQLNVDLENCYGIKKLKYQFDFSAHKSYAIYAPNGAMKSSFANTFQDVAYDAPSQDRIFPTRVAKRVIVDGAGTSLPKESVFVVMPYNEQFSHSEKTSTLLVNATLRESYQQLHTDVDRATAELLKALKSQSASRRDMGKEISQCILQRDDAFHSALISVIDEVRADQNASFKDVPYDVVFNDHVLKFLGTEDIRTAIDLYIKKYNELLANSSYFKKGGFDYYNASTVAKSLNSNGFFGAKHTISLNSGEKREISSAKELVDLVAAEKEKISEDKELRKKFDDITKLITKNEAVREFDGYLAAHEELLVELADVVTFRKKVLISYLRAKVEPLNGLIGALQAAEAGVKEIEAQAANERTQWEAVIDIFNQRFTVPFKVEAENRTSIVLGKDSLLSLNFTFKEGDESATVDKPSLMKVLSTGERKALYILNIIFETEARRIAGQPTLLIVDDIADSFDYKNKYAIIQYLKDLSEEACFRMLILTHNFDFFRTVESRFVHRSCCLMISKSQAGILLEPAVGIRNIFINDWKPNFFRDPKKRIACIPFLRNLIEYTRGGSDAEFLELTSLLHWKANTLGVTHDRLDAIYNALFNKAGTSNEGAKPVVDSVHEQAQACLTAAAGINFENKIVLSIAIRLAIEKFVVEKINDAAFMATITGNQTPALLKKFQEQFPREDTALQTIEQVILMTPENIHLNSFMYEPIMDMSDEHLRQLYSDVLNLK